VTVQLGVETGTLRIFRDGGQVVPLGSLRVGDHLHGRISWTIDGEAVPTFAYFGPGDACVGEWATCFPRLLRALETTPFEWEFPYPDQGDPQLILRRLEDRVRVEVNEYESDDWSGEPVETWQAECSWSELREQIERFLVECRNAVLSVAPKTGEKWWRKHVGP